MDRGCEPDWDKILEEAFMAGIEGAIIGLATAGLGKIANKFLGKLNLCSKMQGVMKKVLCPGMNVAVGVASGMGGSATYDALAPDNCFVAGTPVWVLKEGVDAETANAAIENGASWEDYAEQKPIEEVEAGDFALSRPEDNADGQLSFNLITETYTNTTEEVVELWVVNYATGEYDHITTTPGHPFWVGEWTLAGDLTSGDQLTDADGAALTVTSSASHTRTAATFNFCVDKDHTYYVGGTSTWTHNQSTHYNVGGGVGYDPRAARWRDLATGRFVRSTEGMARSLAARIGKNSVRFRTPSTTGHIDLVSGSRGPQGHFDKVTGKRIPTPHVQEMPLGTNPRTGRQFGIASKQTVRPATKQDLRTARKQACR